MASDQRQLDFDSKLHLSDRVFLQHSAGVYKTNYPAMVNYRACQAIALDTKKIQGGKRQMSHLAQNALIQEFWWHMSDCTSNAASSQLPFPY